LNVLSDQTVDFHDEIDGAPALFRNAGQVAFDQGRCRRLDEVRDQFSTVVGIVFEWELFGVGRQEKIKWIENRHLCDQIDFDFQFPGRLREHQPRKIVGLRILLPIDEVLGWRHGQRIRQNAGAAMRRRPKSHDLRAQVHRSVVPIVGNVI